MSVPCTSSSNITVLSLYPTDWKHLDPKTALVSRCFLAFLFIDLMLFCLRAIVVSQIGQINIYLSLQTKYTKYYLLVTSCGVGLDLS